MKRYISKHAPEQHPEWPAVLIWTGEPTMYGVRHYYARRSDGVEVFRAGGWPDPLTPLERAEFNRLSAIAHQAKTEATEKARIAALANLPRQAFVEWENGHYWKQGKADDGKTRRHWRAKAMMAWQGRWGVVATDQEMENESQRRYK